ncbi:hypothetical protein LNV09_17635 [Paucibacter sp. B2R-40]|uniref:hypothetical protein n=1 Tax=Paucibacter sp. B2R-40 TaxID=2893554 RepID=UPI0021E4272E|nr:hypothetical protein [Paucibacter sp. B2R-40]MCV2355967.1 hypothetical protein [Paucibacter sp. B2R-40]
MQQNVAAWGRLRQYLAPESSLLSLVQLVVPSGPRQASQVTAQRRQKYRDHLTKIIAEALNEPEPEAQRVSEPQPQQANSDGPSPASQTFASKLPGRLCAFCGGGCCTRGGNEAYLTAATMRRVLAEQPKLQTSKRLLDCYLDRVPSKSQSGSCINHGPQGCSLSREMRSDICNNYACEALARLQYAQRQAEKSTPQPAELAVLVLRRKQDNWLRGTLGLDNAIKAGAILSESGIEHLTASRPLGIKRAKRSVDQADDRSGNSVPASASLQTVCLDSLDSI